MKGEAHSDKLQLSPNSQAPHLRQHVILLSQNFTLCCSLSSTLFLATADCRFKEKDCMLPVHYQSAVSSFVAGEYLAANMLDVIQVLVKTKQS